MEHAPPQLARWDAYSTHVLTTLSSQVQNMIMQSLIQWAKDQLCMLPSFDASNIALPRATNGRPEDPSLSAFRNEYFAHVPNQLRRNIKFMWTLGDGNCLLNSLFMSLKLRSATTILHHTRKPSISPCAYVQGVHMIRLAMTLMHIIEAHRTEMLPSVVSGHHTLTTLVNEIAQPGGWLSADNAVVLASLIRRDIVMLSPLIRGNRRTHAIIPYTPLDTPQQTLKPPPVLIASGRYSPTHTIQPDCLHRFHPDHFNPLIHSNHFSGAILSTDTHVAWGGILPIYPDPGTYPHVYHTAPRNICGVSRVTPLQAAHTDRAAHLETGPSDNPRSPNPAPTVQNLNHESSPTNTSSQRHGAASGANTLPSPRYTPLQPAHVPECSVGSPRLPRREESHTTHTARTEQRNTSEREGQRVMSPPRTKVNTKQRTKPMAAVVAPKYPDIRKHLNDMRRPARAPVAAQPQPPPPRALDPTGPISIMTFNTRGILTNKPDVLTVLDRYQPDVLLVTETKLASLGENSMVRVEDTDRITRGLAVTRTDRPA